MRVIVTGGAGFIGSHLVERLLERGDEVVCVDDFNDFYDPRRKWANLNHMALAHPRFDLIEGDFAAPEVLCAAFAAPPTAVVHMAARAGVRPSLAAPALYYRVNCENTANLLEACREHGIARFVFASSSSVYGGNTKVPFAESDPVDRPVSPYAATKRAGELLCATYNHLYGIHTTCLRFFTVYGPRQRPEMAIHQFARLIEAGESLPMFGDGGSARDYTYVDDIVEGVLRALDRPAGFRIYNLGSSRPIPLADLITMLGEALGVRPKVEQRSSQPGDVEATSADITRAAEELGYSPNVPFEEGLRRFVEWFEDASG